MSISNDYLFAQMSPDPENGSKVECTEPRQNKKVTGARKWICNNLLLLLTLLGVVAGAIIGFSLRSLPPSKTTITLLSYPGELFIRLLKLIILPLIITTLIAGSASLNTRLNGRIALRTFLYFLITSIINTVLGVLLAVLVHPGDPGLKDATKTSTKSTSVLDSLLDLGRNFIADNIFQATFQQTYTEQINTTMRVLNETSGTFYTMTATTPVLKYRSGTNTLGVVVFCLVFGTILGSLGHRAKPVVQFFTVLFDVVMKMVTGAIWLTPIGVCSVVAGNILSVSNIALVMSQLGWFIVTVIIGVYIYQLIIMQGIYFIFVRKNPFKFYLGLCPSVLTAFATASTAAALPLTFTLMENKLKVDTRITRFVLPIGCNINMDGTALFVSVATVFFAQTHSIPLGFGELVTICFVSTAASFSSASVPSAALVLILMVLSSVNIPEQDVFLLFAVDWLVDRFRTTNNMLGDCYAAAVVEKLSKKELMACDAVLPEVSSETSVVPKNGDIVIRNGVNGPSK